MKAYNKTGTFTDQPTRTSRTCYHWSTPTANERTGGAKPGVQTLTVTNGGQNADFFINFCRRTGSTTLSVGLHFVDGNEACGARSTASRSLSNQ